MLQVMRDTNRNIKKSTSKELPYESQEYNKQKRLSMALIIAFAISIAILGVASLPAVYAQDDAPKADARKSEDELMNDPATLTAYRKAVIDYKLIFETGAAVSAIVDSGTPAADVDLNKVKDYWNSQRTPEDENVWDLSEMINRFMHHSPLTVVR